jgi:DNA (cytosine-5)-methyltransferase 1
MNARPLPSHITVHDQFCGAGGNSIAMEAEGAEVVRAWNHNPVAIDTHSRNFPKTEHELTDICTADPRRYERATLLVTSPECKHHTDADGQKKPSNQMTLFEDDDVDPTAERSRMTMAQVVRFAEVIGYEAIIVENVVQVRKWRYFEEWCQALRKLGYCLQECYLNSAFFAPTPQSRDRLYIVCTKKHLPAPNLDYRPKAWCQHCGHDVEARQVWRDPHKPYGKWRVQYDYRCSTSRCGRVVIPYYYAAWNVIDWSLEATKIGDRARPLKPNTIRRIEYGLKKFGQEPGLVDMAYTHTPARRAQPLTDPYATQTTTEARGLYVPPFLLGQQSSAVARPVTDMMPSIAGAGAISLTTPPFIMPLDHGDSAKGPETLFRALSTQTSRQDKALVIPPFIIELRNHGQASGLEDLLATITAGGNHHGLTIPPAFLTSYYGTDTGHPLTEAMPTQPSMDRHALVLAPFLVSYYTRDDASSGLSEPLPVQTAEPRHGLLTPQALARVDDCLFRMLHWTEVRRSMAFPESYLISGNARQIVNQLGNAVTPPAVQWLGHAVIAVLDPRQV